jgi:hypothetical protein
MAQDPKIRVETFPINNNDVDTINARVNEIVAEGYSIVSTSTYTVNKDPRPETFICFVFEKGKK